MTDGNGWKQGGTPKPLEDVTATLQGKVFADQGYLSKLLLERLWQRGLRWVTGIRRKAKNHATGKDALSASRRHSPDPEVASFPI